MSKNDYTDNDLVLLLNENCQDAFTEIYNRYWERMYNAAIYKLKSTYDAEEIIQEVFVDIWKRRNTLTIQRSLEGYLATAVKYKVINRLALRNRMLSEQLEPLEETSCNHSNWIDFLDFEKQLQDSIIKLPNKCRVVFKLSRLDGLTQKEIAKKLDIAEKTVESHLSKALKTIRSSFQLLFSTFF